ncbi:RNA polymerase sigma-70 factor [Daejeonella sp. H1SJ63]|uniref:RNA polymerase sigma-70 factor n=1 Tax=Daejeonella sp. H1SJ63 TaxID=3034145 RepID=UPI0023ECBF29|nr:RNA polymerase sigma-70 factor [Daejeonella sp. H1SJ63]
MNHNHSEFKFWNADVKEFELLFKSHYVKLTFYANKFLNDIDISKEIASEALTFLWEKRGSLSFTTSVTAYLYKMVQNKCLNYLKHQRIENEYVSYMIRNKLLDEVPEHETNPYHEKELAEQIRKAIDTLPEKCKLVFEMSRFEYLKNREIAEKLNISQNTVERHITIAIEKLRISLGYTISILIAMAQ